MTANLFPSPMKWSDVSERLTRYGVSYRQWDYWSRVGYLGRDARADGSGNYREITPTILRRAAALGTLVQFGMMPSDLTASYADLLATNGIAELDIPHLRVAIEFVPDPDLIGADGDA